MTTANSAGFLSEMAIAEEVTAGTAETTPDKYDYFTGDPALNPTQNVIMGEQVHDRARLKHGLGSYSMGASINQMVEPEGAIGWWLKWGLGAVSSAQQGGTSAYTHTYTPADTLDSFTLWLKRGGNQQIKVPYCVVDTLELSQSVDDALRCTVGIIGQKDQIASDFGSASYSTLSPIMNSALTVSISGASTGQAAQVHNTNISISNGFDVGSGRVHGSRYYSGLVAGKRVVTGSFDMWFDDDTEYEAFWGDKDTPATSPEDTTSTVPLIFDWDTGIEADTSYNYELKTTIPAAVYEGTTVNVGGDRVVQTINFYGEYDATATNEISVELTNTVTSYPDAT